MRRTEKVFVLFAAMSKTHLWESSRLAPMAKRSPKDRATALSMDYLRATVLGGNATARRTPPAVAPSTRAPMAAGIWATYATGVGTAGSLGRRSATVTTPVPITTNDL